MTVRVLHAADAPMACRAARAEFTALFAARFGLILPDEWCDRWWPATAGLSVRRLPVRDDNGTPEAG